MKKNPLIEILKIISLPFVPFIMINMKIYSLFAYLVTGLAHILTFGKYPVSRNPLLVLLAFPVIQILLFPSLIIMMIKGVPSTEAVSQAMNSTFEKYNRTKYTPDTVILR